ncbi:Highly reducing polyketide synthase ZEA2 [Labeo rohita]|uniref:Highly reducing polyketide synthase ZEA2 n=1 Tax=Labeo rohita TaxID=84645 RepID=A0ABQ8L5J5_LABRO|nr:Highly reducing polyketide synthase ZEA2 [Labeo rohita]
MKQLYRVPFQRNSDIVKEARFQYVQRIMEFEAEGAHHKFIFVDEAGFNLCKVRRRGRNIIGQRATVTVPGQRGANITMCAASSERLITFLDALKEILIPPEERGLLRPGMTLYVIIWDNVAFHHSRLVNEWWKVYDYRPYEQMPLLEAMNAGCLAISAEDCQGWIRHARRHFAQCIARENIQCNVDENLWHNWQERMD